MSNVLRDKVVLIGMPGCGKTTIGRLLAEKLNYDFYDMDIYIEEKNNKSIKDIFSNGEESFRKLETEACKDLSYKNKAIISSGGGVVKKKENIDILNKDSIIVFIDRPVEKILEDVDIESRPLLKDGKDKLYTLYNERYELYKQSADIIVDNSGDITEVIDNIIIYLRNKIKE